VWEDDLLVGAFIAWAPSAPGLAGVASTEQRALARLASELRGAFCRSKVAAGDLGARAQLLVAARRFGADRFVDYFRGLAGPATLCAGSEPAPFYEPR
jgi:hypothetical protein